ncbi:winged helix-turn-helix transcriptional regulator [Paramicrobacterium chengjingii]|uniref:winged helix-turn-helix transcriptional regulator n=1 Tax=Paramicrobacterium chengjingii TaxID=2769067 RepID=UPI001F169BFC|nr:response regulator transcription factor [Microbacterium chengjingii]
MAHVIVLTPDTSGSLPALDLLSHTVRRIPAVPAELVNAPPADIMIVDGQHDLAQAKALCAILRSTGQPSPVFVALTEGGLAAVSHEWGIADVVLTTAGPAELDARIRLALGRAAPEEQTTVISTSGLVIDEASYSARAQGRPLDLTFKEFELLRFLAANPSRVFTREQLLSEVWGYDYYGGSRTVDVHVRRLRAKLGDMEQLIGTVRNVGYRFNASEGDIPDAAHE